MAGLPTTCSCSFSGKGLAPLFQDSYRKLLIGPFIHRYYLLKCFLLFFDIFLCVFVLHARSISAWGCIHCPRKGKSASTGLVELDAHSAVGITNEGLKSARQQDPILCFQAQSKACTDCREGVGLHWRRWP